MKPIRRQGGQAAAGPQTKDQTRRWSMRTGNVIQAPAPRSARATLLSPCRGVKKGPMATAEARGDEHHGDWRSLWGRSKKAMCCEGKVTGRTPRGKAVKTLCLGISLAAGSVEDPIKRKGKVARSRGLTCRSHLEPRADHDGGKSAWQSGGARRKG